MKKSHAAASEKKTDADGAESPGDREKKHLTTEVALRKKTLRTSRGDTEERANTTS